MVGKIHEQYRDPATCCPLNDCVSKSSRKSQPLEGLRNLNFEWKRVWNIVEPFTYTLFYCLNFTNLSWRLKLCSCSLIISEMYYSEKSQIKFDDLIFYISFSLKNMEQFLIDLRKFFYPIHCQAMSWLTKYCNINCYRFPRRNGKIQCFHCN